MKPINANEAGYERFEILGNDALFTNMRIDRKSLPEGLYAYDLRDSDDCNGEPSELCNYVMVNHLGTVLVKEPIEGAVDGIVLDESDYNYLGEDMSLNDFSGYPKFEPVMS